MDSAEEAHAAASLPVEVAELHVFLAALLLGEQGAEGVELGFGWVTLAGDVHLVVAAVDEVWSDRSGKPVWAWRRRHVPKADVALQGVAVSAAGGRPGELAIAVDGLPPPGPQVQFGVVVVENQHDKSTGHAVLTLLQQGLAAEEVRVLAGERQKDGREQRRQE